MTHERLFDRIDELQQEYVQFWTDICNIESPTDYKAGVDAVGAYIAEKAAARGWRIETHHEEVSGDALCITMNPDAPGKPVCFSGHMDTVHPVGLFGTPAVHRDEEFIYGPGVADCKGGIAVSFLAMAALEDCGFKDRPVKLILQSDEENSSRTSEKRTVQFMAKCAEGCAAFLNTEGGTLEKATLTRKGILKYRFTVTGKAVHASSCCKGVNAIAEAAHKILELEKYKDHTGITCSCDVISGGTAINTVPAECHFDVDVRFADEQQRQTMERKIAELAAVNYIEGTTTTAECLSVRVAMPPNEQNSALFDRLNEICAKAGLPHMEPGHGQGGSDAADMTAVGIPTLDCFGTAPHAIHSIRERSELRSLTDGAKRLAAIALYL